MSRPKPTLAIHKLTSCSGCQAVILNLGDDLLALTEQVDIVHFIEAGVCQPEAPADIALVEGSISTPADQARVHRIRQQSRAVVAIGACACSGGIQALRNARHSDDWAGAIYATPGHLDSLAGSHSLRHQIKVDLELWGCPINARQLLTALQGLLQGVAPLLPTEKLCQECKRQQQVCVLVAKGEPCMGPVTRAGCGALCPQFGTPCYTCFGPSEAPNCEGLAQRLVALGIPPRQVAERFASISIGAPAFDEAYRGLTIPLKAIS
jgi:coenzyme F420-reducing hydrogenase gamma subunit